MKIYSTSHKFRYRDSAVRDPKAYSYTIVNEPTAYPLNKNAIIRLYRMLRKNHGEGVSRTMISNLLSNLAISPNSLEWHYNGNQYVR